jgi:hypothetical protein
MKLEGDKSIRKEARQNTENRTQTTEYEGKDSDELKKRTQFTGLWPKARSTKL